MNKDQFSSYRGKIVESHIPCTLNPRCDSHNAMTVYQKDDGTRDAYCYSCGTFKVVTDSNEAGAPRQNTSTEPAAVQMYGVEECLECPQLELPDRGISQKTCEFYGVRVSLNGMDGVTPVAHLYPYYKNNELTGFKKRIIENKSFYSIGSCTETQLFGQPLFSSGGKTLYITEGECDALALFQAFKNEAGSGFTHFNPPVVSLPHGSASVASSLSNNLNFLNKFKSIVLVFDQDEAGKKATEEACSLLDPSKVRVAYLSEKDANAMLLAHKRNELKWSCLNAERYTPSGIATVSDLADSVNRSPDIGSPWPWPTLTKLTFGRSPGVYGVGSGVGVGKTEFFHELAGYIVYEQQQSVGLFFLEESPTRTLRILAGKPLSKAVHRPDIEIDTGELEASLDKIRSPNRVFIFDHRGDRDWSTIYSQIRHLISVHGVKDIFIDPITACISHEESTDRVLHSIMDDMSRLTHDPYNARIYYSSHLNEPPRDRTSHEEGGRVTESQFAGSRAMVRFSDYIIGLERDKQNPDLIKRNTTTVRILKDRRYGSATGETFEIYYDQASGRYLETDTGF